MSEPRAIAPRAGEVIGDAPDRRVEILADHETMHATWSRFGPGRDGADPHVHRRHHDVFYVLGGELTLRLGLEDEQVTAPAGTLARVPPMVVHGFRNAGDAELRYLNFHAPGTGFATYMRALRDGGPLDFDQEPPPATGVRPRSDARIGTGEVVVDEDDLRVALLADVDEVGISEARAAPGHPAPPPHVHERHAESFYVLEGTIAITLAGGAVELTPGSWITLPPGVAHAVALTGATPVRFVNVHAPSAGFGAFVRALRDTGGDPEAAAARAPFDERPVA